MHIYIVDMRLLEHTFFASREIGTLFESEPLVGNYALTYALGFCAAPYRLEARANGPTYAQDLGPLNGRGLYVTPAEFSSLRMTITTFNAQTDSYYYRFAQNAIATSREKVRAMNFPQTGRIRMLGRDSLARFYLLDRDHTIADATAPRPPVYIRLGKFMSKARLSWSRPYKAELVTREPQSVSGLINSADLPATGDLLAYSTYNIHPAPVLRDLIMAGQFWHFTHNGEKIHLPADMRYGVD